MTPPEIALWLALRRNDAGLRFRRQYPAGPYVLDFYCAPARLAVEVDGEVLGRGDRPARDHKRDAWCAERDVRVLGYPASALVADLDALVRQIWAAAIKRRDAPSA
jgi:very-short-patch-repair endonuclease